jgi:hypothetical protein
MKSRLPGFVVALWAVLPVAAEPADAVVRLPSHGASGTVIHTEKGRSLILSCAHAFEGLARATPIQLDVPCRNPGSPRSGRIRLLAVDYRLDLSLLELNDGPLDYVCPVAPAGYRPGRCLSVGYDEMRLPARQAMATLLGSDRGITFTREIPWHGRSGGGLIDRDAGCLIGVVQGYEVGGERRGLYVSHEAILKFLKSLPSPPLRERILLPSPPVFRGRGVGGEGVEPPASAPAPPTPLPPSTGREGRRWCPT